MSEGGGVSGGFGDFFLGVCGGMVLDFGFGFGKGGVVEKG